MDAETPRKGKRTPKCIEFTKKGGKVFGVVSVLTSLAFAIHNSANNDGHDSNVPYNFHRRKFDKHFTQKCFLHDDCKLEGRNIDECKNGESLATQITAIPINNYSTGASLTMADGKFKKSQLGNGWLANITMILKELLIKDSVLSIITKKAFAGHFFSGTLSHLQTFNSVLRIAKIHLNLDAESFKKAIFDRSCCSTLKLDKEALNGIDETSETFKLHPFKLSPKELINLTGPPGKHSCNLQILNLSRNCIPELEKHSLINISNVTRLHLQNRYIHKLHEKAFQRGNSIKHLNLTPYDLNVVPRKVFWNLSNLNNHGAELRGHNWTCNCSMNWLKNYYLRSNYADTPIPPVCAEEELHELEF